MMAIQIAAMDEAPCELLSLVGHETLAHQISVQRHQRHLAEMVQLILMRHVMMVTQVMVMVAVPHATLNQDTHVQMLAQVNDLQFVKMEL